MGARQLALVAALIFPFGLAFGAAAMAHGMSAGQAIVTSAAVFAGAAQFAALELWRTPFPLLSLTLVTFAVNARHIILGASLAPFVNPLPLPQRLLALLFLSDANFAVSRSAFRNGETDVGHLIGGGLVLWAAWVLGTAAGSMIGDASGTLRLFGIDAVMIAFFSAVLAADLKSAPLRIPAAGAAFAAIIGHFVFPEGWNIIVAAIAGGAIGAVQHAD